MRATGRFARRLAAAAAAGALAVAGFAPAEFFVALVASLALLVHLWSREQASARAAALGFAFGLGFFGAGVSWVYVSLARFGGLAPPLAAAATAVFCALLALFPAAVGALQAKVPAAPLARALAVVPGLWALAEALRGWLFTGFPWLSVGHAVPGTPLAGYAPLGGTVAASLAVVCLAGCTWAVAARKGRLGALALAAALLGAGALASRIAWTEPAAAPLRVALLQGNVAQDLKFDPERWPRTVQTYARLAEGTRARLIVLPETALPRFLDTIEPAVIERLAAAARRNGGDLVLGVPVRAPGGRYWNSVVTLGVSPSARYDKVHLVPFGEFAPPGFAWFARALAIPLSDFSRGAADQRPLAAAGERLAVSICYENAFGAEVRAQLPEATLLVNVSNVAWFGDSLAPAQHLQIGRFRALETGRPLLAATNTGITAVVGADGAVLARLPQFREGALEAEIAGRRGQTPYVRTGDAPALAAALALVVLAPWLRRR